MQWLVSTIITVAAPLGDAYLFIVNCPYLMTWSSSPSNQNLVSSYPLTIFNLLISGGLLLLYTPAFKSYGWRPPFRAWKAVTGFFFLSNVFLTIVPMIPPSPGFDVYEHLPYWVRHHYLLHVQTKRNWRLDAVPCRSGTVDRFDWNYILVHLLWLDT